MPAAVAEMELADRASKVALHQLAADPRFVKFGQLPTVLCVEIESPVIGEDLHAYEARVIAPGMRHLIARLPDDLVQFIEVALPKSAEEATRASAQGLSVQYQRHFNILRREMVRTLGVAYIPTQP